MATPGFTGKSLLRLDDFAPQELTVFLDLADELKRERRAGCVRNTHKGKTLALLFQKPSLRTRASFDVAFMELGGNTFYLGPDEVGVGTREDPRDIAEVLGRYVHGIVARVYGHDIVEAFAEYAGVPVINGLSDLTHPCQVLADLQTIREKKGRLAGLKLAFIGEGNNVAHSLLLGGTSFGMHITIACPKRHEPKAEIVSRARDLAALYGGSVEVTRDVSAAAEGADVLYTDVWASMGIEPEREDRKKAFAGYRITMDLLKRARKDAIVLHCLPAHYGEEIDEEVMRCPQSAIFDEAENRLHTQKAVLALLI